MLASYWIIFILKTILHNKNIFKSTKNIFYVGYFCFSFFLDSEKL